MSDIQQAAIRQLGIKPGEAGQSIMTLRFRDEASLAHAQSIVPAAIAGDIAVSTDLFPSMRLPVDGRVKAVEFREFLGAAGTPDKSIAAFHTILVNAVAQAQASLLPNIGVRPVDLNAPAQTVASVLPASTIRLG